jgi:leucine dehydrogenase
MSLRQREIKIPGYEKVIKVVDEKTGLKAIIAIHDTRLGPAVGGTRIFPYKDFDAALTDALRLAKGMTLKSAVVQNGTGGGKSVIIADPKTEKNPELLTSFAEAVERLKGTYICSEDSGCTVDDVEIIRQTTKYVTGLRHEKGSGNPSVFTAYGIFRGMQAVVKEMDGTDSLKGKRIAIQGIGNVGKILMDRLFWAGADLIISDVDEEKIHRFAHQYGVKVVPSDKILFTECDILAPCALGGILNANTIPKLKCRAVAGAANNQLHTEEDAKRLAERGILYAPDFIINAGGLLNATSELSSLGYNAKDSRDKVSHLYDQLLAIFHIAKKNRVSTNEAAMALVEYRLKYGVGRRVDPLCFPNML